MVSEPTRRDRAKGHGAEAQSKAGKGSAGLEGSLERITFHNEENGYTVARLLPDGKRHPVTIVGNMHGLSVGASLRLRGRWTSHAQYGRQFQVEDYTERLPATVEGIRRYLGSGMIRGVGPKTAERIVDHFGLETLEVIEERPEKLREVPGVGAHRVNQISEAWIEQKQIKEVMLFLQSHGVSTSLAVKIFKAYGDQSVAVVKRDPYRLAHEVWGIGFKTADEIAARLGLPSDSPARLRAGLLYALGQLADAGHALAPEEMLLREAEQLLEVETELIQPEIHSLAEKQEIILEDLRKIAVDIQLDSAVPEDSAELVDGAPKLGIYLPPYYYAEVGVAGGIRRLLDEPNSVLQRFRNLDWETGLNWLDQRRKYPLASRQREAVKMALTEKASVLTGGPGTGKTTTVRAILDMLEVQGGTALLAAPTGRAAKRLSETTGIEAKTLHRLLEFSPGEGRPFKRGRDNPLKADLVVVDEVSMVDVLLMNSLIQAIDPSSHVVFVGDTDQLPSVGAGNVLRDLLSSQAVPAVALDEIFRQEENSHIVVNAHRINRGEMPLLERESKDFFLFKAEEAEEAADWVVDVVQNRVPRKFGLDPVRDIQVLSPMHRGEAGVGNLNERLQAALNPPREDRPEVRFAGKRFRLGDKLMQMRNNYEKDVYNGDVGRLVRVDAQEQLAALRFDGREVSYQFNELDELVLAYACSTHKSQGSEYPAVVMALLPAHHMLLQRNLLYTGITRAKDLCVIVGSKRAIQRAVGNDKVAERHTGLAARLKGLVL